ncbi:MAG TPA: hypothetical protein VJ553_00270 [Candidatus Paceibacterota bacterium]|nr:hypothetical protein [Candidatus Paceibacterota bacterium]
MTYHALLEYIREAKVAGASDQDIRAQLTGVGWYTVDVQDALHLYGKLSSVEQRPSSVSLPKPSLSERLVPRRYDPHLVAVASVAFAVGFVGYLLIASF